MRTFQMNENFLSGQTSSGCHQCDQESRQDQEADLISETIGWKTGTINQKQKLQTQVQHDKAGI